MLLKLDDVKSIVQFDIDDPVPLETYTMHDPLFPRIHEFSIFVIHFTVNIATDF